MRDHLLDAKKFNPRGFWIGFLIFCLAATTSVTLASLTARHGPVFVTTIEESYQDKDIIQ